MRTYYDDEHSSCFSLIAFATNMPFISLWTEAVNGFANKISSSTAHAQALTLGPLRRAEDVRSHDGNHANADAGLIIFLGGL